MLLMNDDIGENVGVIKIYPKRYCSRKSVHTRNPSLQSSLRIALELNPLSR